MLLKQYIFLPVFFCILLIVAGCGDSSGGGSTGGTGGGTGGGGGGGGGGTGGGGGYPSIDLVAPVPGANQGITGKIDVLNLDSTFLTLQWVAGTDNVTASANLRYQVYQSSADDIGTVNEAELNGDLLMDWTTNVTTIDVTDLVPETTYYFNVLLRDEMYYTEEYLMVSATTLPDTTPPVPGNGGVFTVTNVTGTSFILSWTGATDNYTPPGSLLYKVVRSAVNTPSDNIASLATAEANGTLVQDWTPSLTMRELVFLPLGSTTYFNVIVKDAKNNSAVYTMGSQATRGALPLAQTNGPVQTMARDGNTLYIGGSFTRVGVHTGAGIILNAATGTLQANAVSSEVYGGEVYTAVPDGSGRWYIGGTFSSVRGVVRNGMARINADGTVDSWNPNISGGPVCAIVISGSKIIAAGNFSSVNGSMQSCLVALDEKTGATLPLQTQGAWVEEQINTLLLNGSILYYGGNFDGLLKAVNIDTGAAVPFDARITGTSVKLLLLSGTTIYVAGNFSQIGGRSIANLAAINAANGDAYPWDPGAGSGFIQAMALSGTTLYVGGTFLSIGGKSRNRIAALDTTIDTAMATDWNPDANGEVNFITVNGSTVYVGGTFSTIGGQSRNRIAALDATTLTNNATAWNPTFSDSCLCLSFNGTSVFTGGSRSNLIGGVERSRIAALDLGTGLPTAWNPGADNGISVLKVSGSIVYAGGSFTSIGGQTRNRIAALDTTTNSNNATTWNPGADGSVVELLLNGTDLYVGGYFTTIGGQSRVGIARLVTSSNTATAWHPVIDVSLGPKGVGALLLNGTGSTLYIGGVFETAGGVGVSRYNIAALDTAANTNNATSWDPHANDMVGDLILSGTTLYVGGGFISIGGQDRHNIAALDTTTDTSNATAWNPGANGTITDMLLDGTTLYVAGLFVNIGGAARRSLAALDTTTMTNNATAWNPFPNDDVNCLEMNGSTVYAGGKFTTIGAIVRNYIVAIEKSSGIPY